MIVILILYDLPTAITFLVGLINNPKLLGNAENTGCPRCFTKTVGKVCRTRTWSYDDFYLFLLNDLISDCMFSGYKFTQVQQYRISTNNESF